MKKLISLQLALVMLFFIACQPATKKMNYSSYAEYPTYNGSDLGLTFTATGAVFKVWSPIAEQMELRLYDADLGGESILTKTMTQEEGVWTASLAEDITGKFYTFRAFIDGKWNNEVTDPYVKAVGRNGQRGQVINASTIHPQGWDTDQSPELTQKNDIVLYELHVRDLSSYTNSGITAKGKFLGLTETGTTTDKGTPTGLDHIKDLGVTHVHILPAYDYNSVDETKLDEPQYNWGYDPQNYNVPEGSYSTNPADGSVRIKEFKQMVQTMHANGLRVVMDVVYNHTGATLESNFNQLVPFYYYRQNAEGGFSDGSWCGNETASDRPMYRKFMLESLVYWMEEYHIDGFRFDLMGIHDIETMNLISKTLHEKNPSVFLYGEGWGGDPVTMSEDLRCVKANAKKLVNIAVFSDDMRDGLKGHVFEEKTPGFVSGLDSMEQTIKFGIVGSLQHSDIDYSSVFYSKSPFANFSHQTINYCSAHDNHTLWDKLTISRPDATEAERIAMHKLANTIVLTSQGVPFLHAGVEFLRTKHLDHNSYKSADSINWLDWDRKAQYIDVYNYYKQLIALRKAHPAFRMATPEQIETSLHFLEGADHLVAYTLSDNANGDSWKTILVAFNGGATSKNLKLQDGNWNVVLKQGDFVNNQQAKGTIEIPPYSAFIAYQQ